MLILQPILVIFVTLDAPRKGLQNPFNVQRPLTNVNKVIKFYLQRFSHTCLFTIIKLEYYLCTNTLQTFYPIFVPEKRIPMDYIKTPFSFLVATLYSMSSMQ
jgi:hypothetical protein